MDDQLAEKFDKAIDLIISQLTKATKPNCDEVMKFSQAILNLTNAKLGLEGKKKPTS
jgi:hypothetical protein